MWVVGMERKVHNHEILPKKYLDIDCDGKRADCDEPWY